MTTCKYCTPNKQNRCKPLVKCIDRLNGYEEIELKHAIPCKAFPNRDEWHLKASRFGVGIYVQINYCPICGRKLEAKE